MVAGTNKEPQVDPSEKVTKPLTPQQYGLPYFEDDGEFLETDSMAMQALQRGAILDTPEDTKAIEVALIGLEPYLPLLVSGLRQIFDIRLSTLQLNNREILESIINGLAVSKYMFEFNFNGLQTTAVKEAKDIAERLKEILPNTEEFPLDIKIEQIPGRILLTVGIIES